MRAGKAGLVGAGVVGALAIAALSVSAAEPDPRDMQGHAILAAKCAHCHNIERVGPSPYPKAPPFRTLSQRYPLERLAEPLAEGIVTGHPAMPQFVFSPSEIDAILSYMGAISEKTAP